MMLMIVKKFFNHLVRPLKRVPQQLELSTVGWFWPFWLLLALLRISAIILPNCRGQHAVLLELSSGKIHENP